MKKVLFFILLSFFTSSMFAQLYVGNGAELSSSSNGFIYSNLDVVNEGSITITSDTDLVLDAGLTNTAATAQLNLQEGRLVVGSGQPTSASTDVFIFKERNSEQIGDQVKRLLLNKTSGTVNVTGGHLGITESLESVSGTFNGANNVTLLNRVDGEYAQVIESTAGVVGVEVERFIPAKRAYRLLSPSVTSTQNINAQWQEGAMSYNANPFLGFGTHITGFGSVNTTPIETNQDGLDWNPSGVATLFPYDNDSQEWGDAISNTLTETASNQKPLRLFVRGDRSTDLTNNNATPSTTILRTRGNLAIGTHTVTGLSTQSNHFNFVANPYASRVDFNQVSKTNISDFMYVWDPNLNTAGAYVAVDLSSGVPSPTGSQASRIVMPGQAFFVRSTSLGNPSITFNESHKNTSADHTSVFSQEQYLNLRIQTNFEGEFLNIDGVGLRFDSSFNIEVDDNDGFKIGNPDENLVLFKDGSLLTIEKRPLPIGEETIQLAFIGHQYQTYRFIPQFVIDNQDTQMYLRDNYLDTMHELVNDQAIEFEIDPSIPESIAPFRFELVFNPTTLSTTKFEENLFAIYPNPAIDHVRVVLPSVETTEKWSLEIFDISGKKVFNSTIDAQSIEYTLNVSKLNTGVYLINLVNGKTQLSNKLIKK